MEKIFIAAIIFILTNGSFGQTPQTDVSIKSDTAEIKIRGTNVTYFIDGVKILPCDTIAFANLMNAQIKQLDHKAKENFFISNTFSLNTDSLPHGTNYMFCEDKLFLNKISSKKGTLIRPDKYDGHSIIYYLYRPFFDTRLNYYVIKVRSSNGEWGGATVLYYYKRQGKKFKLAKKHVTSVS